MKWIEVIKINVADNRRAVVESQIESIMLGLNEKMDKKADQLKLYRNLLDNDLSLHLCWTKGTAEPWGSKLGQCLTHLLKEAGLVSHSVWVEEKRGITSRLSIAAPSPSHIATAVKIRKEGHSSKEHEKEESKCL
jgi:hypothetical protein